MSGFVYFLLFLWSIVQTGVFWLLLLEAIKTGGISIVVFILVILVIGFLNIFFSGQIHKGEKKRFLFKTIVNAITSAVRLPIHIIVFVLTLFDIEPDMDWGCFDEDNWVSIIIYSATLIDVEPSWGDFPDRVGGRDSSSKFAQKVRKDISKGSNPAIKPYVDSSSDGRVHGASDVLNHGRGVAKYCSTYLWEYGNRVDIDFTARLSGNTITFVYNMKHSIKKPFNTLDEKNKFEEDLLYSLKRQKKEIEEMMNKWSSNNALDGDYYINFEKGSINF